MLLRVTGVLGSSVAYPVIFTVAVAVAIAVPAAGLAAASGLAARGNGETAGRNFARFG